MSLRIGAEEAPGTGATPVFVDDSGRRRAWLRVGGRAVVVLLAAYAAFVAIGLAGTLTLPVVNLGEVGRPSAKARAATLGAGARHAARPAARVPSQVRRAGPVANRQRAGGPPVGRPLAGAAVAAEVPRRVVSVTAPGPTTAPGQTTAPTAGTMAAVQHGKSRKFKSTPGARATTVSPVTGTVTHGQQMGHGNGPPASVPGKGKGS
jgi:hypothetical protein